jgi:hypothetical protein
MHSRILMMQSAWRCGQGGGAVWACGKAHQVEGTQPHGTHTTLRVQRPNPVPGRVHSMPRDGRACAQAGAHAGAERRHPLTSGTHCRLNRARRNCCVAASWQSERKSAGATSSMRYSDHMRIPC